MSVKAHCNECSGDRNHVVLHSKKVTWSDDEHGISSVDLYEMLECLGCNAIKLRHTSNFSEDDDATVRYFPPSQFRRTPDWLSTLWLDVGSAEEFVHDLLSEVYTALQNNQPHLAAMGIRSLLERIMIAKIGDQRSFGKNLAEFEAKGFVSRVQRERLETILEAGHAAIHRSYKPSPVDLVTLVDICESIVETVYLHGEKIEALRRRVPKRV